MVSMHKLLMDNKVPGTEKITFTAIYEETEMAEASFLATPDRENQATMIVQNPTAYVLYCLMCSIKAMTACIQ